jgi:hypothetical protein
VRAGACCTPPAVRPPGAAAPSQTRLPPAFCQQQSSVHGPNITWGNSQAALPGLTGSVCAALPVGAGMLASSWYPVCVAPGVLVALSWNPVQLPPP